MTLKTKQERHIELHRNLDELLACYITETKKTLRDTTLLEFVQWSGAMTENPTCEREAGVEPATSRGSNSPMLSH